MTDLLHIRLPPHQSAVTKVTAMRSSLADDTSRWSRARDKEHPLTEIVRAAPSFRRSRVMTWMVTHPEDRFAAVPPRLTRIGEEPHTIARRCAVVAWTNERLRS